MSNTNYQPLSIGYISFRSADGTYQIVWEDGPKRISVLLSEIWEDDLEWIYFEFPTWVADSVLEGNSVSDAAAKTLRVFYAAIKAERERRKDVGSDRNSIPVYPSRPY